MLNPQDIKDIIKAELKKDKSKSVKDMCQVCEVNKKHSFNYGIRLYAYT